MEMLSIAQSHWSCVYEQKNAIAVAHCKAGKGVMRVNGKPLELVEPVRDSLCLRRCVL